MKGTLPKSIAASILQCAKCINFRDDDPDIFYCNIDRPEFAALCDEYRYRGLEYKVLNEDDGELS